jgi:hypothetical protein
MLRDPRTWAAACDSVFKMKTLTQYPGAIHYVLYQSSERERHHRAQVYAFLRLALPLLFILAVGLIAGCLVAIGEASFSP